MVGETKITTEELNFIVKLLKVIKERNLFGTEEELFKKLRKNNGEFSTLFLGLKDRH